MAKPKKTRVRKYVDSKKKEIHERLERLDLTIARYENERDGLLADLQEVEELEVELED